MLTTLYKITQNNIPFTMAAEPVDVGSKSEEEILDIVKKKYEGKSVRDFFIRAMLKYVHVGKR